MEKKILIVAGEASGDLHCANLITHLTQHTPDLSFYGLGGKKMKAAGVEISCDLTQLAVVGFSEILKNYSKLKNIFSDIVKKTKNLKPDIAILADYPGFNLRLAKILKKQGIQIIYFISPQIWAWGAKRINLIKKTVDLMLVFFKFEEKLYSDGRFNVKFIGHPLLDIVKPSIDRQKLLEKIGFNPQTPTIALLPGSREHEVSRLLPIMLQSAQRIFKKQENAQFLICRTNVLPREFYKRIIAQEKIDFPYKITEDLTYASVNASELTIVASGTATLETAILNKPMIIIYKASFLTWLLAKLFIKIPHIGLVNVLAGRKIVPELVQFNATAKKISRKALKLLKDKEELNKMHANLYALKNSLGMPGVYQRAADEVGKFLKK